MRLELPGKRLGLLVLILRPVGSILLLPGLILGLPGLSLCLTAFSLSPAGFGVVACRLGSTPIVEEPGFTVSMRTKQLTCFL